MKKINKNKEQKKYANLSLILNDKSDYLKNLERKRNDGIKIIKSQKARILIEDIFKLNKFTRNYSCFPFNSCKDNDIMPLNKNLSEFINYPFKPKIIKDYTNKKYNNVEIEKPEKSEKPVIDNYIQIPKNIYSIKHINNYRNNRNKLLAKAGKDVFSNNYNNISYDKKKFRKKYY